ncbi:MAG: hypothetical protein A2W80_01150 [Candidatus Riflebacteria bacterium GWC2_50_8]|nr:MAG: hypothetical protein A2W80_01150 [Candidatus Riflebacteria bacterium GWC2_50_8]
MSKLVMNSENEIPLRHEFICTGFFERVASWARFLCLSFLFLLLLTTAVNLIYPFAIDPPLFYNQLLFFLLACAAFEIFAIPIEAIKDHCIIDLQKTMVVKIYNRYLYTRVEVLATFDKIKSIGVSARPEPMFKGVFSETPNRFAILMLTEKGQLHRLTDYNLGLDEANRLVKSLHESYLRHIDVVSGTENCELCLDRHMSNSFVQRPCQRSSLTLIDAALIPSFQAALGTILVAVLIAITAMVGDFVSDRLFNTSLKISHQPIFQLVLAPARPETEQQILTPPEGPPPALPFTQTQTVSAVIATATRSTIEVSAPAATAQQTSTTVPDSIEIAAVSAEIKPGQSITAIPPQTGAVDNSSRIIPDDKVTPPAVADIKPVAVATAEQTTPPDAFALIPPPVDFIVVVDESNTSSAPEQTEPVAKPVATQSLPPVTDSPSLRPDTRIAQKTAEKVAVKAEKVSAKRTEAPKALVPAPVLMPLPSRIPTFDENAILSPEVAAAEVVQPVKMFVPPQIGYHAGDKKTIPVSPARPQPEVIFAKTTVPTANSDSDSVNPRTEVAYLAKPPVKQATETAASAQSPAISAASYIGQKVNFALNSLGKPLTAIKTTTGQQLIYSGITLLTDSINETIVQVNLTGRQSKKIGTLATQEGLMVGSLVREAKARLGIPQQRANSPGLHFPTRGISIYPLPGDTEKIGSIQIYQSRAQTGH